jgi:hypothetical protein
MAESLYHTLDLAAVCEFYEIQAEKGLWRCHESQFSSATAQSRSSENLTNGNETVSGPLPCSSLSLTSPARSSTPTQRTSRCS